MPSTLGVAPSSFTARSRGGRQWQRRFPDSTATFLDWTIDAVALLDHLAPAMRRAKLSSRWMTNLTTNHPDALAQLDLLLGDGESMLDDGRVVLYVCPDCSDLWCGTISTELVVTRELVHWGAIGFQTPGRPPEIFAPAEHVTFARPQYENVLTELRLRFARRGGAEIVASAEGPVAQSRPRRRPPRPRAEEVVD